MGKLEEGNGEVNPGSVLFEYHGRYSASTGVATLRVPTGYPNLAASAKIFAWTSGFESGAPGNITSRTSIWTFLDGSSPSLLVLQVLESPLWLSTHFSPRASGGMWNPFPPTPSSF